MSARQAPKRTSVLLNRVDGALDTLLSKFAEIVSLAANSGKDQATVASEVVQIEADAASLVRAAEDLLFVTRSLKEAWILGQIRVQQDRQNDETSDTMDKVMDRILE